MFVTRKELRALKRAALYQIHNEFGEVEYVSLEKAINTLAEACGVDLRWKTGVEGKIIAVKRK